METKGYEEPSVVVEERDSCAELQVIGVCGVASNAMKGRYGIQLTL